MSYEISGPACCRENAKVIAHYWWTCTWGSFQSGCSWARTGPNEPTITIFPYHVAHNKGHELKNNRGALQTDSGSWVYPGLAEQRYNNTYHPYHLQIRSKGSIEMSLCCDGEKRTERFESNTVGFGWHSADDPSEQPSVK